MLKYGVTHRSLNRVSVQNIVGQSGRVSNREKPKRIHDSKIKNRVFNVGDRVLLFNSRLKIFSGKLKTRWSGPFTVTQVFPYGTVELSQNSGPNFKVNGHRLKHYFGGDIPTEVVPGFVYQSFTQWTNKFVGDGSSVGTLNKRFDFPGLSKLSYLQYSQEFHILSFILEIQIAMALGEGLTKTLILAILEEGVDVISHYASNGINLDGLGCVSPFFEEEDFVMGEGVVVSSSSLDRSTKSCLGGMMERISKKRTKNKAKTTKPDSEWKRLAKIEAVNLSQHKHKKHNKKPGTSIKERDERVVRSS
ncbi:hypothetical protein Tco_1523429 [Tanacetum coccineum]